MNSSPQGALRFMPMCVRIVCGLVGICLLLLSVDVGLTVHPLLWKPLFAVFSLVCLAGDFLSGAFTARWPLPTAYLL